MPPLQAIANLFGAAGLIGAAVMVGRAYQMLRDLRGEVRTMHARLELLGDQMAGLRAAIQAMAQAQPDVTRRVR